VTERKNGKQKRTFVTIGLGLLAIGFAVWMVRGNGSGSASLQPTESILTGTMEDIGGQRALIDLGTPVEIGDPQAPITITEFGDYQCPACQDFASLIKPQIDLEYIQPGIARFVFYDYPRHNHSFLAHRAARCALDQGTEKYWNYHNRLFARQTAWAVSGSPPMGAFESIADEIGLDGDDFSSCLSSDRHADVVTANLRVGLELQIMGTPSILVSMGTGAPVRVSRWNEFSAIKEVVDRLMMEETGEGSE
jgi:protein-disulfide isomerase